VFFRGSECGFKLSMHWIEQFTRTVSFALYVLTGQKRNQLEKKPPHPTLTGVPFSAGPKFQIFQP
jgi:hypothetical protein